MRIRVAVVLMGFIQKSIIKPNYLDDGKNLAAI